MSHIDPGPLASYGSLSDPNLSAFFNNSRMRKHLIKSGLVTRSGEIVSEKVFRLNNARKEHQRHVRDLLAQAIVHKALDMERHRQMQIKRQLEEIGKVERVRRVRADRALRGDEDILPLFSPPPGIKKQERPHTAPAGKSSQKLSSDSSEVKSRQLPQSVGYPAIPGDSPYNTRSSRIKTPYPNVEIDNQYLSQLDHQALRSFTLNLPNYDLGSGVSPYTVPVLDPAGREIVQPPKVRKPKKVRPVKRPSTAIGIVNSKEGVSGLTRTSNKRSLALHRQEPPMIYRTQSRSLCLVTFKYLGQIISLDHETEDPRDEIMVDQQHCGGGNLCVYRGKLMPGDKFTIISQRHRNYPFSLTFYLNRIMVERLSSCCEYKHKMGNKLGAKSSHFGFVSVKGAHPCFKCLVSSGRVRSMSNQTAQNQNTFQKRDLSRKLNVSSPNKPKPEDTYDDGFDSTDQSSEISTVSALTDEDNNRGTPKKYYGSSKDASARTSPSPKSSSVTSPKISNPGSSKSSFFGSDTERKSKPKKSSHVNKKSKKRRGSSSQSTSSISTLSVSDDEE